MTVQEKERITRLRGEGKSYGAIATLLGISASKVKSYCTMAKSITRIDVKKTGPSSAKACRGLCACFDGYGTADAFAVRAGQLLQ